MVAPYKPIQPTSHTKRVTLNRAKVDELRIGIADALFGVTLEILDTAVPPDRTPYGRGLIEGGGAVAWVDRKKVNGTTIGGKQIRKPRHLKLDTGQFGIVSIVGYGFPGRFVHNGTQHSRANPFLQRAALEVLPEAKGIAGTRLKRFLRGWR